MHTGTAGTFFLLLRSHDAVEMAMVRYEIREDYIWVEVFRP